MRLLAATVAAVQAASRRTKEAWFRFAQAPVPGPWGSTTEWTKDAPLVGNLTGLDASEVPQDAVVGNRRTFVFAWVGPDLKAGDRIGRDAPAFEVVALLESPSDGRSTRRVVVAMGHAPEAP